MNNIDTKENLIKELEYWKSFEPTSNNGKWWRQTKIDNFTQKINDLENETKRRNEDKTKEST